MEYNRAQLNEKKARQISDRLTGELAARIPTCALRNGDAELCESCLEVGKHGKSWQSNGEMVKASFQDNVLEVGRERPGTSTPDRFIRRVREMEANVLWWQSRAFWEPLLTAITLLGIILGAISQWQQWNSSIATASYLVAYLAGGFFGTLDGYKTLQARRLDVNFLMIAAALGAAVVGEAPEGAMLLFLFSLSNTLQNFALARSRRAIRALMALQPETATRLVNGEPEVVPIDSLTVGDRVLVKPGERIPADGAVAKGESHVDQSSITGESVPVHKFAGSIAYTGTLNGNGVLEIEVSHPPENSLLSRIMILVERAQEQKARTQRWLERFEQRYAIAVIGGSALTALALPTLFGWAFHDAFYRAMTLLVVASPCALVISTPATLLSAIANAARRGVLLKGGEPLERLAEVRAIAFDKTGTLTEGKLHFTDLVPSSPGLEPQAWQLIADIESLSEHPLAQALATAATERGYTPQLVDNFQAVVGKGVRAYKDGALLLVGNPRLFEDELGHPPPDQVLQTLNTLRQQGKTSMILYAGGNWLGVTAVADQVRASAKPALQQLKLMGVQATIMLTGDAEPIARTIANEIGIERVYADLLPDEKLDALDALEKEYGAVAMVGDGVNDAPALAAASVGIAMGAGTDVALETADIALIGNDLNHLPYVLGLSHHAMRVLKQNLTFAIGVIAVLIILTFWQGLMLPLGVVGHEGSTLLVVLNGLRLLGYRPHPEAAA
jgi:Cd2+/Zn2+-exporting ATPase